MARILDWQVWQEYNKYTKEYHWEGLAIVDHQYETDEDYEAAIEVCNELHRKRWKKVLGHLGVSDPVEVPAHLVQQLNAHNAGDLREYSGRHRADGSRLKPDKRIDMIKVARKIGVAPGDNQWEVKVLDAIREGHD